MAKDYSVGRHHAEWLSLVETSGPFLSMPVLQRVFPQGLEGHDPDHAGTLRLAFAEGEENQGEPAIHDAWVRFVLEQTLEFPEEVLLEGQALPPGLEARIAEHGETLRPDFAVVNPEDETEAGKARLLVQVYPREQDLERAVQGLRWKASPATRTMELLHATDVRLGLVTNGEQWMLVHAPRGETTGFASWYASLWSEEQITLRAFRSLLSVHRFFGVADEDTLEAMYAESASNQQEVTDQLGHQVRQAVEVLVDTVDRIDKDRGRDLLAGYDEKRLYEAALTVMMRLVFLFSAEERGLLLLGDPLYDEHYAVSTLRERLREDADKQGEEVLERRHDAWSRLLATFRAVHGGVQHEAMRLPAYGGTLFDPDRYPFLEGRERGTTWRETPAKPLPIHNRAVLHLLEALQVLRVKVPGGGPAEARRLSFRALDIEQIGHVYEGLLDHTALYADETVLGLSGKEEPEVPLSTLEELREKGEDELVKFLKKETGRSAPALKKGLAAGPADEGRWRVVFEGDDELTERARHFAGLVRDDMSGYPVVVLAGSVYVTKGSDRRESGTHYTPRSLTEPIVQHTLDPLVYEGPAEGWPKEEWRLRTAGKILALTVCDMAMGSGAFLVQACRYLSERLVEAWEEAGEDRAPDDSSLPADAEERLALARRLVADQCLYGVDKNPLAVEMGKLSLWLITLQKDRPFTFLDHALRCGDSLLGITKPDQLTHWSLDLDAARDRPWLTVSTEKALHTALDLRRQLHSFPVLSVRDAEAKARLLREAEEAMELVRLGADLLTAAALQPAKQREGMNDALLSEFHVQALAYEKLREGAFTGEGEAEVRKGFAELRERADELLGGRRPFHWPLEFPEVFAETEEPSIIDGRLPMDVGDLLAELSKPREEFVSGFAAIVGNPPFKGGKQLKGIFGDTMVTFIRSLFPNIKGSPDLVAYFLLRATNVLVQEGCSGLICTKSIFQGETRESSLDYLSRSRDVDFYRMVENQKWPGSAAVNIAIVWMQKSKQLNWPADEVSEEQSPDKRYTLASNTGQCFQGTNIVNSGFALSSEEANKILTVSPKSKEVLFPLYEGSALNSTPDVTYQRWVIDFRDWPLERAKEYPQCLHIVEDKVLPKRKNSNRKRYREFWWQFGERQQGLYTAAAELPRVLAIAYTSNTLAFAFVPSRGVIYYNCSVVCADRFAHFAMLQSGIHLEWVREYGSTLKGDARYAPERCFEPFPFPLALHDFEDIGERYYAHRQGIMQSRQEGLTKTYNRFHAPDESAEDIARLRELHVEMDEAVAEAYGWGDLDLGHGFHQTKQGVRYTISEEARREILDRLLLLNHERYAEEVEQGLHDKKPKSRGKKQKNTGDKGTDSLLNPGDEA